MRTRLTGFISLSLSLPALCSLLSIHRGDRHTHPSALCFFSPFVHHTLAFALSLSPSTQYGPWLNPDMAVPSSPAALSSRAFEERLSELSAICLLLFIACARASIESLPPPTFATVEDERLDHMNEEKTELGGAGGEEEGEEEEEGERRRRRRGGEEEEQDQEEEQQEKTEQHSRSKKSSRGRRRERKEGAEAHRGRVLRRQC